MFTAGAGLIVVCVLPVFYLISSIGSVSSIVITSVAIMFILLAFFKQSNALLVKVVKDNHIN